MGQPTLVAVAGAAGAIGRSTAAEFDRRAIAYRVIGRDRARLEAAFAGRAEIHPADIADPAQARSAFEGCDTLIYCVGLHYPQHYLHPVLFRTAVEAARQAGVTSLALISSVYAYGAPRTPRVAESHPREPIARKGQYRKEQEDIALALNDGGPLASLALRLPDFYGPHAELSLADQVFQGALTGKPANWIGPVDLPHEFVYVPDVGPAVAELLARQDSFGKAWNFGGPGTITGLEFIRQAYAAAGAKPRYRTAGRFLLALGGLFDPVLRELREMYYLAETPVILDDSRLAAHLGGLAKTPYSEGIVKTVAWYRNRGE